MASHAHRRRVLVIAIVLAAAAAGCGRAPGAGPGPVALTAAGPAVVPWLDRPAPPYQHPPAPTPEPYPTSTPRCLAGQLRVAAGRGGVALGHELEVFVLTNVSASTCLLGGRPQVSAIDPSGTRVILGPRSETFFGVLLPADLAPGAHGYLDFETATACPPQGRPITYRSLEIVLPGGGTLTTGLGVADGSCGLSMEGLGLRPPPAPGEPAAAAGSPGSLDAQLRLPASATVGAALRYVVTLANRSSTPVRLSPCPSYTEILGWPDGGSATFRLNCDPVRTIAPGTSRSFAMEMLVPAGAQPGATKFGWRLDTASEPFAGGTLTVAVNS